MTGPIWKRIKILVGICSLIVLIYLINLLSGGYLNQFGIIPRTINGLSHILLAPFIHNSMGHLLNNLIAMVIFSAICLVRSVKLYIYSSLFIILVSGLLVWLFGRNASHIGASSWVFGLWGLSIAMAWFDRSISNILIAVFVIFFYGGMIFEILPADASVSFESHIFGLIAGIAFAAIFISRKNRFITFE